MQTQLRAENGVEEVVVGYVCDNETEQASTQSIATQMEHKQVTELMDALGDDAIQTTAENLPQEIRDMYLAEVHRIKTGEFRPATEFSVLKEG